MITTILFASEHWSIINSDTGEQLEYGHGHGALLKWLVKHDLGAHEVEQYLAVPIEQAEAFEKFVKSEEKLDA